MAGAHARHGLNVGIGNVVSGRPELPCQLRAVNDLTGLRLLNARPDEILRGILGTPHLSLEFRS